jgi:hypothetical protein
MLRRGLRPNGIMVQRDATTRVCELKGTSGAGAENCRHGRGMSFLELPHQNSANGEICPSQLVAVTRAADSDQSLDAVRGYRFQLMQLDGGPSAPVPCLG